MRMTSRLRSRKLWAFSVLRARMRYASVSSGEISAVICFSPRTLPAAKRWRPLGVHKRPSSPRTTISGSRKAAVASILTASRFAWVGDKSRWKGVGWTALRGNDARTSGRPPSGFPIGADERASSVSYQRDDVGDFCAVHGDDDIGGIQASGACARSELSARALGARRFAGTGGHEGTVLPTARGLQYHSSSSS